MRKSASLLLLVLAFILVSCRSDAPSGRATKSWTYLFYVAGDEEEIDRYSRVPLRKLEQMGSDESRWIVAHTDFHFDESGKTPVSEPARRYEIGHFPGAIDPADFATLKIQSREVWHSEGETDSGSPESLRDFLRWATAEYPAEHYAVFILGHSWGWRGVGQDYNPGFELPPVSRAPAVEFTMMTVGDVRDALRDGMPGGRPVDLLVMDVCNNAALEFAYVIRDRAKVWVAAATEMPFMSFEYARSLANSADAWTLAKRLVTEALQSFGRGGSQVRLEGDYPGVSIMAVDVQKLNALWPLLKSLVDELPRTNFRSHFFDGRHDRWLDLALNVDLAELMAELQKKSDSASVRDTAARIATLLGEPAARIAPDTEWKEVATGGADVARFTFQGDELLSSGKAIEKAKESFDYSNPQWTDVNKSWKVTVETPGSRVIDVSFPISGETIRFRPFIAGAGWVNLDLMKGGAELNHERYEASSTVYVRDDYPAASPYIVSGHTFGAGRNLGLSLNFDPTIDPERAENYHYFPAEHRWVGGRDYYRTLDFAKELGWGALVLAP